jgi:flavin-dependent dehydrogenase
MTDAPVVVVGGGLAGSAFAIARARQGRAVTVLERTNGAHHKVCGEFLSAEAQTLLAKLGLDVWAMGASPVTELGLEFGGHLVRVKLPFRGAGLSRLRLDQALLDAAAKAGAQVLRGVTVTRIDPQAQSIVVHAAAGPLAASHLVLATGKHNLRGVPRPLTANVAFKMQLRPSATAAATLDNLVHLSMFRGGYVGVCMVEDGIATVAWVIEREVLGDTGAGWDDHADYLSRRSPFFARILSRATALWDKPVAVAAIPYGFLRADTIADAIYPVGDQLVVIPSYTGDGTSIALHTGVAAAEAILAGQTARAFQDAALAKLRPQIAWAKLANIAFVNTTAQRVTAAVAQLMPWAMPHVATFVTNKTRFRV